MRWHAMSDRMAVAGYSATRQQPRDAHRWPETVPSGRLRVGSYGAYIVARQGGSSAEVSPRPPTHRCSTT
jgi:hypothetical protein